MLLDGKYFCLDNKCEFVFLNKTLRYTIALEI